MDLPPVAPASETGFGFTPVAEEAAAAETAPRAGEAKFTAASMWTDEEARFAAIDIEATPLEEPAAASEAPAEAIHSPSRDEAASAYTTQPNRPVAAPMPIEAAEPMAGPGPEEPASAPPQAAPGAPMVELSPTLIDEIVRRVVAQISESVVREIAWEVVPDCVERVIKEVTAQEASKR
jgi:hypothetical protein